MRVCWHMSCVHSHMHVSKQARKMYLCICHSRQAYTSPHRHYRTRYAAYFATLTPHEKKLVPGGYRPTAYGWSLKTPEWC